jgi:hypothetical protein
MTALSTITVNDGASTPVAHAFVPVTTDGFLATLKERVGVPVGYPTLTASVRPPVKGGDVYKEVIKLTIPTTATINGITAIDYSNSGTIELFLSERSTAQSRKDLRVMLANLLAHATVVSMVESLEPMY